MVFPPANLLVPAAPGSLRPIAPPLKCRRGFAVGIAEIGVSGIRAGFAERDSGSKSISSRSNFVAATEFFTARSKVLSAFSRYLVVRTDFACRYRGLEWRVAAVIFYPIGRCT
jgi:hypothetical protein